MEAPGTLLVIFIAVMVWLFVTLFLRSSVKSSDRRSAPC